MNFKQTIFLIIVCASSSLTFANDVDVNGYYKNDGTYVQPHHRTSPDNDKSDNWSTEGNINPYTGKKGTKNP